MSASASPPTPRVPADAAATATADSSVVTLVPIPPTPAVAYPSTPDADLQLVCSLISTHENFPSPGITFKDIFPVFRSPKATRVLLTRLTSVLQTRYPLPDVIVGLDSRGFLFGPTLAMSLDAAFVPVRKAGKLPGPCESFKYTTEYSTAVCEIQKDSIKPGQKVIIVDDLLATGGTLGSAVSLIRSLGGVVVACLVVIELGECGGRAKLTSKFGMHSDNVHSIITY